MGGWGNVHSWQRQSENPLRLAESPRLRHLSLWEPTVVSVLRLEVGRILAQPVCASFCADCAWVPADACCARSSRSIVVVVAMSAGAPVAAISPSPSMQSRMALAPHERHQLHQASAGAALDADLRLPSGSFVYGTRIGAQCLQKDGAFVEVRHPQFQTRFIHVQVRIAPNGAVFLASCSVPKATGGCLRIKENGSLDYRGQFGPWCQFRVYEEQSQHVRFGSVANKEKLWGLAVSSDGALWIGTAPLQGPLSAFEVREVVAANPTVGFPAEHLIDPPGHGSRPGTAASPLTPAEFCKELFTLAAEMKNGFYQNGFFIVQDLVPLDLVLAALRHCNSLLAHQPGDGLEGSGDPAIVRLAMSSRVWSVVNALFGPGNVHPTGGGQLALRFPGNRASGASIIEGRSWHVDGVEKGQHSSFTLLVGIALSAQMTDDCGNLYVFPGSHHHTPKYIREYLKNGPENTSKPSFPNAHAVRMSPGSVVFAHHKLAHAIGHNNSPHIRYQVYFRFSHKDHQRFLEQGDLLLNNIFAEFQM